MTDAELDAACLRMVPVAHAFVAAVKSRDQNAVRAAFAVIQAFDAPMGWSPMSLLSLVLADELTMRETANGAGLRAERDRCRRLALATVGDGGPEVYTRLKRLPERIARGEQP